jgi:hypothetical protein
MRGKKGRESMDSECERKVKESVREGVHSRRKEVPYAERVGVVSISYECK